MISRLAAILAALVVAAPLSLAPAIAHDEKLKFEELDQLLVPIALYPDDLLTNVLVAFDLSARCGRGGALEYATREH